MPSRLHSKHVVTKWSGRFVHSSDVLGPPSTFMPRTLCLRNVSDQQLSENDIQSRNSFALRQNGRNCFAVTAVNSTKATHARQKMPQHAMLGTLLVYCTCLLYTSCWWQLWYNFGLRTVWRTAVNVLIWRYTLVFFSKLMSPPTIWNAFPRESRSNTRWNVLCCQLLQDIVITTAKL